MVRITGSFLKNYETGGMIVMSILEQRSQDSVTGGKSLTETLEKVMRQIEYHCFTDLRRNRIDPFYKELCLVIAEVLVLNPESTLKINGVLMYAPVVQEVYLQLHNDHVRLVFQNFHSVSTRIYNKKAYLRTALYNVVFELESNYINEYNSL